jgi:hypothetical protein
MSMATSALTTRDFIEAFAAELSSGIDAAVETWLAAVDRALNDPELTTLGRMNAAKEILEHYKNLTGKTQLRARRPLVA